MKKVLTTIFIVIMILTVAGVALMPHSAEAFCLSATTCVMDIASVISEKILEVVSWFLAVCGVLLNVAIVLTLNIKVLYQATPAIDQVWVVIRNISSIFIIFGLLYTSIMTIFGVDSIGGVKKIIKNIIIAGLLINFSLFFTKALIDASNLVSLQFYRAIVPNSKNVDIGSANLSEIISSSFAGGGGISDVFMAGLKIPKIYNEKQGILQTGNTSLMIIIHTILGSILMIIAGLTLIAAAIAFTARIVFLLLFMAFSPVYFIGIIFPQVAKKSGEYVDKFINLLIFMPLYLLLLYVAMKFIGEGNFFTSLNSTAVPSGDTTIAKLLLADVGLIFQYGFALILINIPLMAAIQYGASVPKWANDVKGMAGKWVGSAGSFAGQHSLGRAAKVVGDKLATSRWSKSNPNLAIFANNNLAKVSGGTFGGSKGGYDKRFANHTKERLEYATKRSKFSADVKEANQKALDKKLAEEMAKWDANTENKGKDRKQAIIENERKIRKDIEEQARSDSYNEMAKAYSKDWNPITRAANKKAADLIKDELIKTPEDVNLQNIIKGLGDAVKPKEESK